MGDHRSGANERTFADGHARQNDRSASDRCTSLDSSGHDLPVCLGLQPAVIRRARIQVVDEHDSMADKNVIFDGDSFTDESVRRNLAPAPNERIFLNLDEGADLGLVAHIATIEIDQISLEDLHSVAQENIGRNWHQDRRVRFSARSEKDSALRCFTASSIKMEQVAQYNRMLLASTASCHRVGST